MKNIKIGLRIFISFMILVGITLGTVIMIFIFNTNAINRMSRIGHQTTLQINCNDAIDLWNNSRILYKIVEYAIDEDSYNLAVDYINQAISEIDAMVTYTRDTKDINTFLPIVQDVKSGFETYADNLHTIQGLNNELLDCYDEINESSQQLNTLMFNTVEKNKNTANASAYITIAQLTSSFQSLFLSYTYSYDYDEYYSGVELYEEAMSLLDKVGGDDAQQIKNSALDLFNIMDKYNSINMRFEEGDPKFISDDEILSANISTLVKTLDTAIQDVVTMTHDNAITALTAILIVMVCYIILAVTLAVILKQSITTPIHKMISAANALAEGDVNCNAEYISKDEVGQLSTAFINMIKAIKIQVAFVETLANGNFSHHIKVRSDKDEMNNSFNDMIDKLNETFNTIQESSRSVYAGATQISDGSKILADGSSQQAIAVEGLSKVIEQITEKTIENTGKAKDAADVSNNIKQDANVGAGQMDQMINAVKDIENASQSISDVIKVIDSIAFQTNILALNAAVEAARAGEHGKGFAVVADEVRNLASKSADAAKNVNTLILNSLEKAEIGAKIASETAVSFKKIVTGINESVNLITNVASESQGQLAQIQGINSDIDKISYVVQQNTAAAEESASSAKELTDQCEILEDLINTFELKR